MNNDNKCRCIKAPLQDGYVVNDCPVQDELFGHNAVVEEVPTPSNNDKEGWEKEFELFVRNIPAAYDFTYTDGEQVVGIDGATTEQISDWWLEKIAKRDEEMRKEICRCLAVDGFAVRPLDVVDRVSKETLVKTLARIISLLPNSTSK